MKTMTCKQLGGACNKKFQAENLAELAALSKLHGIEMFEKKDPLHLQAMAKIQWNLQKPHATQAWFEKIKNEFDALPEE